MTDVAKLSSAAEAAAKGLADEVRDKVRAIPTTDTERIAIQVRVAELLGGPRA